MPASLCAPFFKCESVFLANCCWIQVGRRAGGGPFPGPMADDPEPAALPPDLATAGVALGGLSSGDEGSPSQMLEGVFDALPFEEGEQWGYRGNVSPPSPVHPLLDRSRSPRRGGYTLCPFLDLSKPRRHVDVDDVQVAAATAPFCASSPDGPDHAGDVGELLGDAAEEPGDRDRDAAKTSWDVNFSDCEEDSSDGASDDSDDSDGEEASDKDSDGAASDGGLIEAWGAEVRAAATATEGVVEESSALAAPVLQPHAGTNSSEHDSSRVPLRREARPSHSVPAAPTDVKQPDWPPDVLWWMQDMWTGFLPLRLKRGGFRRPLNVELLCAGTGAELMGAKLMGIPVNVQGVADSKRMSQRWLRRQWGRVAQHMYTDNRALFGPAGGQCFLHGRHCRGPQLHQRPDVASGGFPCQPYTNLRQKTGSTPKTGAVTSHPFCAVVMDGLMEYVENRKPYVLWIEEVDGFMRQLAVLGHRSPCSVVVEALKSKGYAVTVLRMNHEIYIAAKRPRVFLVAVSKECGGQRGCEFVESTVEAMLMRRQTGPTMTLWDTICDPHDPAEIARRKAAQASF